MVGRFRRGVETDIVTGNCGDIAYFRADKRFFPYQGVCGMMIRTLDGGKKEGVSALTMTYRTTS